MATIGKIHSKSGMAMVYFERRRISLRIPWDGKGEPPEEASNRRREMVRRVEAGLSPVPETRSSADQFMVGHLIADFLDAAQARSQTDYRCLRHQLKWLADLHAHTPVEQFGPLLLAEFMQGLVNNGRSRQGVNRLLNLTKRVFRHGVALETVRPERLVALQAVQPLRRGSTPARETNVRGPVEPELFERTMSFIRPKYFEPVFRLLRLTGCRPGEIAGLAWDDVDTTGKQWVLRLRQHKTAHKGKARNIPLAPKAQAILQWMPGERVGRVWPKVNTSRLATAVADACKLNGLPIWSPNQIRKLVAQQVRETMGLEYARALLGHSSIEMTAGFYAKEDLKKASQAVEGLG